MIKRVVIHATEDARRSSIIEAELGKFYPGEYDIFPAIMRPKASQGIIESFQQVIRQNIDQPFIHIFEDDVHFTHKDSRFYFEETFSSLPPDWDIFLGGSYSFQNFFAHIPGTVKPGSYGDDEFENKYIKIGHFASLHCVIIRNTVYEKILSHNPTSELELDRYLGTLANAGQISVYLCNPQIAIQHNGYSFNARKEVVLDGFLRDKNILKDG